MANHPWSIPTQAYHSLSKRLKIPNSCLHILTLCHIEGTHLNSTRKMEISLSLTRSQRLTVIIGISFSFFVAEIAGKKECGAVPHHVAIDLQPALVGFTTRSLALIADAFHYVC